MAEQFRYAAFISYSSKDERFARRLHRALETYGIPSALGKFDLLADGSARNRVYPVFRDREELSAGDLGERIEDALTASGALIVVCSPHAAASLWVQKEIEFFHRLSRRNRVYAIIAANAPLLGLVGEDATLLCLPSALRGDASADPEAREAIAADARKGKDGFRNACLKLIAGLVGVTPGQLIDRDRRRRWRGRVVLGVGGAALAAAAALGIALFSERDWRAEALRVASSTIAEGRPLDALPYVIAAGLPAGTAIPLPATRADAALVQAGQLRIGADFGIEDQVFPRPLDYAPVLITATYEGHQYYYDLAHDGERRHLGRTFQNASARDGEQRYLGVRLFGSDNGAILITRTQDGRATLHDLTNGGARRDLVRLREIKGSNVEFYDERGYQDVIATQAEDGSLVYYNQTPRPVRRELGQVKEFAISRNGIALVAISNDGHLLHFDIARGGARRDLGPASGFDLARNGAGVIAFNPNQRPVYWDLRAAGARRTLEASGMRPGPVTNAWTSSSGALVILRAGDGTGIYYDLTRSGMPQSLGDKAMWERATISENGAAFVLTTKPEFDYERTRNFRTDGFVANAAFWDMAHDGKRRDLGPLLNNIKLSDDGRVLVTQDMEGNVAYYDLARGGQRRDLGKAHHFELSGDGAILVTQLLDFQARRYDGAYHNLARGEERRDLGQIESFSLAKNGTTLVVKQKDGALVYYDLARGGARRNLGNFGATYSARYSLSDNGAALVATNADGIGFYYDLTRGGAPINLGKVKGGMLDYRFTRTGSAVVVKRADERWLYYDLRRRAWEGQAPRGAALRAAVCAASGDAVQPFPLALREPAGADVDEPDGARVLRSAVRGRPWNPCDWRGLAAILPNAERGDGWLEGLRQWTRLVSVRFFGGKDWTCEETTSAASALTRARREVMCGRYAPLTLTDVDALGRVAGEWTGTYTCRQGETALRLTIGESAGRASATFAFSPTPANPSVPRGTFTVAGGYEARARRLDLNPVAWVGDSSPGGYSMVGLVGTFDGSLRTFRGRIKAEGCGEVRLSRS